MMKAVVFDSPKNISIKKVAIPKPQSGWALVRLKVSALCATDIEIYEGNIGTVYPIVPGHEWSGEVVEVGSSDDKSWVGKRVVGSNDVCCLVCQHCRSGNWRNCADFKEIGFKLNGAYAEYMLVPVYALYELPDCISFEQGAIIEPMAVGLGVVERSGLKLGETLTVIGAGSVGLNCIAVAKAAGARNIIAAATTEARLNFAKKAGASLTVATLKTDLTEYVKNKHIDGSDVIIEATGVMDCFNTSLNIVKKEGRIVLAGYGRGKSAEVILDKIHLPNLRIIGAGNNFNLVSRCIDLIKDKLVDTSWFVTHSFFIDDFDKAFELTNKRPEGFIKSIIKW